MGFNATPPVRQNEPYNREAINGINAAINGKTNNRGQVTLAAGVAVTTLFDARIGADSVVLLMPVTASAGAALAGFYFGAPVRGQVDIHHLVSPATDMIVNYCVVG